MNVRDIEAQAKALAPILRNYVAKAIDALRAELFAGQDDRFKSLSNDLGARIETISAVDLDALAKQAAELIPAPERGEDGKSITIEDIQPAIDEAVVKAISAMPVPKDGNPGEPGKDGAGIDADAVAAMIEQQVIKAIGEIEIVAPQDGKPGRDALDIDLMPLIDEGKSYPRGTWATHNGGIWRAHSNTSGLRGWECVVDGFCSHDVEQLDPRNYESVTRFSSGKETRRKMSLPNTVYREIYKAGTLYTKGDLVTWGGSLWYCCEDTDTKPGESPAWKLAAKKGRDGKS